MNIHKNARLTPIGRERLVRQVESGQTPEAAARPVEAPHGRPPGGSALCEALPRRMRRIRHERQICVMPKANGSRRDFVRFLVGSREI